MATSGSIDFIVTRDDIITEALELLGVLGEGESPTAAQLTSSARTLNMLIKNWQADGLNLFAVKRQYLFTDTTVREYSLSSSTTHHFTESFGSTEIATAATALDTTIEVDSISGISDGDYIGIHTTNAMEWTTVNGAPSGTTVTLSGALENDAAVDNKVYFYTSKANRPMKVLEAFIKLTDSDTDVPIEIISRRKYNELAVKSATGVINQIYYDPQVGTGKMFVWPVSNNACDYLTLFVQRSLEDVDSASDNFDMPQEWYMPLAYNLAMHLAPKYGIPQNDYYVVERQATALYERAQGFDEELYTSVFFEPNHRGLS